MSHSQGKGFTVSRVEAFSDGVLAIVINLLVLEIKPPELLNHESTHEAWKVLVAVCSKDQGH